MNYIITTCDEKGIPIAVCSNSFLISSGKLNVVPLMSDSYAEIIKTQVKILNEDWNFGFHLRAVCIQLLAGALWVEKNEVMLSNCIELYSRINRLDAHSEKFYVEDSVPIIGNVALERILCDIAERITPRLEELNSKVIKEIIKFSK
ncbi:hypothetical protein INT48_000660 [Thamnidium elegans]|uniref:Uncharacterized protein n=1 Tax=Thamnidium elegans TaxID=101142 RepID=A0A8H7W1N4_9FUNG|nr:hypothetical protein INT48_000660 [Thamnidium elegans]